MRTERWRVAFRPEGFLSSLLLFFLVLVPSAFSQQQKPVQTAAPPTAPKPVSGVAAATNDRIAQLAQASEVKQGEYVIGSGDLLGVEVFDIPELSRDVRVTETGYIALPLLATKIHAQGLTPYQLQDKLAELLQTNGLVTTPQVTVTIKEQHGQPITVIGEVKTPMVIQALRQTTLLEALSQAGGIADDAGNTVLVTRQPQPVAAPEDSAAPPVMTPSQTFTINLADVLESGDPRFNIPLVGGDVVSVPRAGIIYVVGAVNHPGGFVIQNDRDRMTTLKMLSLAGGATNTAKPKDAIILRKNTVTGKRDEVPVDLNKIMHKPTQDIQLEASDILYVPDSSGKRALHRAGDIAVSLTTGVAIVAAGRL
ncbi:MAG TPA: polysaccharide biosynthesis/export family protein [Candidatus Acidoferrales bacterium]|nr:polysaccharide biosynthesis/export family protein [Candidatus Acidoferrales bacterium]